MCMHAFSILILSLKVELKENVMCNEPRLFLWEKSESRFYMILG